MQKYGDPLHLNQALTTTVVQHQAVWQRTFAYGKLYSSAYAGVVYCYDTTNGNLLWTYGNGGSGNTTNSGLETPFGHYPTFINAIGNGVVYTVTTEHTIETPLFKGSLARAINATTGQEIWTVSGYTGEFTTMSYAMADGYNTWFNGYDNSIYVVGRGPSATTVQAPLTSVNVGDKIVIQGTVMDKSTGTTQTQQVGNFPNGVPVSSDASMREWMGYVYQQQPEPTNFTGVTVSLSVVDSNNNFRSIGTATTDASGTYNLNWAPDIPGSYTLYAEFGGTNGYYPIICRNTRLRYFSRTSNNDTHRNAEFRNTLGPIIVLGSCSNCYNRCNSRSRCTDTQKTRIKQTLSFFFFLFNFITS